MTAVVCSREGLVRGHIEFSSIPLLFELVFQPHFRVVRRKKELMSVKVEQGVCFPLKGVQGRLPGGGGVEQHCGS